MSLPKYESYKDSGVEWLGEVPKHWEVKRVKNVANINMGQSPSSQDCNQDGNGTPFLQGNADFGETNPFPRHFCSVANKLSSTGDILFSVRAPVGAINISDQIYGIGRGLCAFTPNKFNFVKFFFFALEIVKSELFSVATGSTYEAVSVEQIANAIFIAPPIIEQNAIAQFLDQETAKIDNLIAEQQQLIKLLKEKRQAVISHAVTKGLNPDVPMKDSGIEWLGEVPEHWDIVPLKYLCKFSGGGTPSKENLSYWTDGNIPWVSPKDMKSFWLSDTQDKLTAIAVNESSTNYVESGALLMVVRSGILQRMIPIAINTVRVTLNQDMKALRFSLKMNVEFAANFILGYQLPLLLEWSKEGATVESIEYEYLSLKFRS